MSSKARNLCLYLAILIIAYAVTADYLYDADLVERLLSPGGERSLTFALCFIGLRLLFIVGAPLLVTLLIIELFVGQTQASADVE